MTREGECSLHPTMEAPPLGGGSGGSPCVCLCVCQCDSKCVCAQACAHTCMRVTYCCLGSPCTFKSSGWGDGGGECWGVCVCWDLLGSLSFLLREQLRFPAGNGWPGLRGVGGMLRPLAHLSAETDAAAGVLSPCTIPTSPQSPLLPLPTRSVPPIV